MSFASRRWCVGSALKKTGMDQTPDQVEAATRSKYSGAVYQPATISQAPSAQRRDYSSRMLSLKMELIRQYCTGAVLVDVCCSTGLQLAALAPGRQLALGIDFSMPFLAHAMRVHQGAIRVVAGNARALPIASGAADAAYSLSSLYHIPNVGDVISEIGRILRPGGRCLLDMGNSRSLNTVVCRAYPELAAPCHVPVADMMEMMRAARLTVLVRRSFQILPMWGDRPASLKWLMAPALIRLLTNEIAGRMIDEWVSSLPVVRGFAFRQVFVCEKAS
jgi:ubiquinone/menaquinone biosynthesis C-methylase UbiE